MTLDEQPLQFGIQPACTHGTILMAEEVERQV